MKNDNLQITIEVTTSQTSEIKEIVKLVAEIQKEYNCNCTLFVKRSF